MRTRVPSAAIAGLLAVALAGCTPSSPPEPTPTPAFASDDEAFAAAEATYRAYVDALNQVDLSDPRTFEAVYDWTTGEANAGARTTFTEMHADGWVVVGTTTLRSMERSDQQFDPNSVGLDICLDVSEVSVFDSYGDSVVAADRRDLQPMLIRFDPADTSTGLAIAMIDGREDGAPCGS